MKIGIHERLWEKNVVAIGLSAGFIEPLESNGLFTVHEFLRQLIRELKRDKISQWERDNFTYRCKYTFRRFAEFVALHYALSHRDDTEYWRNIQNKNWLVKENGEMWKLANARAEAYDFTHIGGIHAIAAGMHYSPTDLSEIMWLNLKNKDMLTKEWTPLIENLNQRKNKWKDAATQAENSYDFLKRYIYN